MSDELKPCSICGMPGIQMWDPEENIIKCSNDSSFCHNAMYGMYFNEWQARPLEDALKATITNNVIVLEAYRAELEAMRTENKGEITMLKIQNEVLRIRLDVTLKALSEIRAR